MSKLLEGWLAVVAFGMTLSACNSRVVQSPPSCESFANEPQQLGVEVVVRNEGNAAIFLGSAECTSPMELLVADSNGNPQQWIDDGCTFTCEDLQHSVIEGCDVACAQPPIIMLMPGGSYHTSWTGSVYLTTSMPTACFADSVAAEDSSCLQLVVAPSDLYTLTTLAWDFARCEDDDCECPINPDGVCQLDFAQLQGEPREASTTVDFPNAHGAEIVFAQPTE